LISAKLGACEVHLGSAREGIRRMQQAVASAPDFGELYDILAAGALLGGDVELAAQTAEARLQVGTPTEFHHRLATLLKEHFAAQQREQAARDTPDSAAQ
jgi:hypothetical protein